MPRKVMMKVMGELISLGTRCYDSAIDGCEHVAFVRRLFRNGEISPPVCRYCGTENKFPLNVSLENDQYILRCTTCREIIFKEG